MLARLSYIWACWTNRLMEAGVVGVGDGTSSSKRILTTPAVPTNSLLLNITF